MLVLWMWIHGSSLVIYALVLFLSVGIGAVNHNHAHRSLWQWQWLNHITDLLLTVLQGHPTFVFHSGHNANHHRHRHGAKDIARTYRFGGDSNHLWGYLTHPVFAVAASYPHFMRWLTRLFRHRPLSFLFCLFQYLLVVLLWGSLAWIDWQKLFFLVLIPQLHGLHWLLASNYLQHAHADGRSKLNFARNFSGWINPLLFNIGYHTAHHLHGTTHWSELPALHQKYHTKIDSQLMERSVISYMLRTYLLSLAFQRYRSQSMMKSES